MGVNAAGLPLSVQIAAANGATIWCCAPLRAIERIATFRESGVAASQDRMLALAQTNPPYGTENIPQIETVNQRRCRMRSS